MLEPVKPSTFQPNGLKFVPRAFVMSTPNVTSATIPSWIVQFVLMRTGEVFRVLVHRHLATASFTVANAALPNRFVALARRGCANMARGNTP